MTARFEAEYDGGISYYGGDWAPGATPGIGLMGKITSGLASAKGRHITFNFKGLQMARIMAALIARHPHIARAIVSEMDHLDNQAARGELRSYPEGMAHRTYMNTGSYGFELHTHFMETAEAAYRAKLDAST